ncbi:ankyrin repeat-containing domain protein [Ephemerocybe angulata]|uniref:Ankyrin repeat-containing domain protein n=1 Tax=Ephemerocybe angulata TaxID=980116 RepID=A0A8H6H774_9AGAR|nr:ankyrin repeat-containing domain protein [Tulosesus angulatus]
MPILSTLGCRIPGNPDISGVGVRSAIYSQNLLCFIPAFWALVDGRVTRDELDAAETQTTTNLVLAFAILVSSIVQAQTLGLTSYHANIVLSMSWMNNTNTFIYFLLYVQHKSQISTRRRVEAKWYAWARYIRHLCTSIITSFKPGRKRGISSREFGRFEGNGVGDTPLGNADERRGAIVIAKRFVLLLGSLHLSLMAGLGLWLWSNIRGFGRTRDDANICAAAHAQGAILGKSVPFASEALRISSFVIYAAFLVPGINLILPMTLFLGLYHCFLPSSQEHSESLSARLRVWIQGRTHRFVVQRWEMLPPFIGLTFLLVVNVVFIADIELTLQQNAALLDQSKEEAEWGFGQILAILCLFMPLRDLAETILARRPKQRRRDLNVGLETAMKSKDWDAILILIQRGADPNVKLNGATAMQIAYKSDDMEAIKSLLHSGADPNIESGSERDTQAINIDNRDCLRLLRRVESGEFDRAEAIRCASTNGYGAGVKLLLASPGINVNSADQRGQTALILASRFGYEALVKLLYAVSNINVNLADEEGRTALMWACIGGHESIVTTLVGARTIEINLANNDGQTALTYAIHCKHEAIVKNLINLVDRNGRTPLIDEITRNNKANVEILCKTGLLDLNLAANPDGTTALILASSKGHTDIVKVLLRANQTIDINTATTLDRKTALISAVEHGHEVIIALLCEAGIDINLATKNGKTALILAVELGHRSIIRRLCARPGISINSATVHRQTALIVASERGDVATVELLCSMAEIDVNLPTTNGQTALILASFEGHEVIVKRLCATPGINVNLATKFDGQTALTLASDQGNQVIVELLGATPGVDINLTTKAGRSPLIMACSRGHIAVVQSLCAMPGINANLLAKDGLNALMTASIRNREMIVGLLCALPRIDVNSATKGGESALTLASDKGHNAVVKVLCATPGVDVNLATKDGQTALMKACHGGHVGVVKLLCAVPDIGINLCTESGQTALMWAAFNGYDAVAKLLCAIPGIDLNVADSTGETALTLAAEMGYLSIVELLSALPGIDINLANGIGQTALILACSEGHEAVVKHLCTMPTIDLNAADSSGQTALMWAFSKAHTGIIQLLFETGGLIAS